MSSEQPTTKPRWWKLVLLPNWLGHTLQFFALMMLLGFPLAVTTSVAATRWTIFAVAIVFSIGYGLYAAHRIRRTVIASDEISYTIRLEWIPLGSTGSDADSDDPKA